MHRFDPYFAIAARSGFVDYRRDPDDSKPIAISLKLASGASPPNLPGMNLDPAPADSRFLTGTTTPDACKALIVNKDVECVLLADPLMPARPGRRLSISAPPIKPVARKKPALARRSDLLLGIIDNGCPFAHRDLLWRGSTRVVSLWSQDGAMTAGACGGAPASDGSLHFDRNDLDRLIEQASVEGGSPDEDLCYRLAGYEPLLQRRSHGAHSLGLMAGAPGAFATPRDMPSFPGRAAAKKSSTAAAGAAPAPGSADIAFVQLPRVLMECVSVAALEHHALRGFRHVLGVARKLGYEQVAISFGYESWVGPHDGSSWFEEALSEMCEAKEPFGFHLYMSAGNARNRRAHAAAKASDDGNLELRWHVPPGNEVPMFLEVWLPTPPGNASATLRAPNGTRVDLPSDPGAECRQPLASAGSGDMVACAHDSPDGAREILLVGIAPTQRLEPSMAAAAYGVWSLDLKNLGKDAEVHAHIGRVQGDPAASRRVCQPVFVGRTDATRLGDEGRTLNGHACGTGPIVSAVYRPATFPYRKVLEDFGPSVVERESSAGYSGAGPTGGERQRPDQSLPMDDGIYLAGTLSIGTRSGSVWRMQGTSTAAPAAARMVANAVTRSPNGQPLPSDPALGTELFESLS